MKYWNGLILLFLTLGQTVQLNTNYSIHYCRPAVPTQCCRICQDPFYCEYNVASILRFCPRCDVGGGTSREDRSDCNGSPRTSRTRLHVNISSLYRIVPVYIRVHANRWFLALITCRWRRTNVILFSPSLNRNTLNIFHWEVHGQILPYFDELVRL